MRLTYDLDVASQDGLCAGEPQQLDDGGVDLEDVAEALLRERDGDDAVVGVEDVEVRVVEHLEEAGEVALKHLAAPVAVHLISQLQQLLGLGRVAQHLLRHAPVEPHRGRRAGVQRQHRLEVLRHQRQVRTRSRPRRRQPLHARVRQQQLRPELHQCSHRLGDLAVDHVAVPAELHVRADLVRLLGVGGFHNLSL